MKLRSCPGCAKFFRKGRKALVDGRMTRVCYTCAGNATRVVTHVTVAKCVTASCNNTASTCGACVTRLVQHALRDATALVLVESSLSALARAFADIAPPEDGTADLAEFVRGKREGIETALAIVHNVQKGGA